VSELHGTPLLAREEVEPLRRRALIVGVLGLLACVAGAFLNPAQFYRSYLTGYVFVLGIALGGFALSLLHRMTRGAWGLMVRRTWEAGARTLPVFAVAFLPIAVGMHSLYHWTHKAAVAADPLLQHKEPYLNATFFLVRAAFYFLVWIGLSTVMDRLYKRQDENAPGDAAVERQMQIFAGPGVLVYALTMTFASFDWLMSLDPHWSSTIYGLYIVAGQAISGLVLAILVAVFLSGRKPMSELYLPNHFHDYGKLLLAFVMLWSYFAISQFLIIWSGDLPEEISFYKPRVEGSWRFVSLALVLLHFALPFALLLSRGRKRDLKRLAGVAMLVLVMRWVDIWWLVAPTFHKEGLALHWLDIAAPLGLGGIFVWLLLGELTKRALLPIHDPNLPAALEAPAHG